jgi:hypothetical protein
LDGEQLFFEPAKREGDGERGTREPEGIDSFQGIRLWVELSFHVICRIRTKGEREKIVKKKRNTQN